MNATPASAILDWMRSRSAPTDRHLDGWVYYARSRDGKDTMSLVTRDAPAETRRDDGTVDRAVESWEWSVLTNRCVVWSTGEHRAVGSIEVMHADSAREALANYYTLDELEGLP